MNDWYSWIKVIHVVAIISWMAGLLYLPRLFVYHCASEKYSIQSETFKIMERKLFRYIMNPAMVISWITGLSLAIGIQAYDHAWFGLKFFLVVCLTASHLWLGALAKAFEKDVNQKSSKFFRLINEVPTLLMLGIVSLVIVKPF